MSIVYEVVRQYMTVLHDVTTVIDETKGFRNFEGRAIIGFIDGTEVPNTVILLKLRSLVMKILSL